MAFSGKSDTNPSSISTTGHIHARADRARSKSRQMMTVDKRAAAVRDYWKRQNFLDEITDYAAKNEKYLFRNQWECTSDKKSLHSRVQWEVDKVTAQMNEDLERRRNRLSELFKGEEAMYLEEASHSVREDPEIQKRRMLDRYTELKIQKEMKRQEIAREKTEQQFRRNCEELRSLVSKKIQRETAEEGKRIILEKEQEMRKRNKEDELYDQMWKMDSEAKRQKEAEEEEEKRKREAINVRCVTDQIAEKKLKKIKKLREKEDEADVMAEQKRLLELEEEWEREMKKLKRSNMKKNLDNCLRAKLKQKAKEVQDDLFQDLFFLKQIMEDEEEKQRNAKKRALMKEQQEYLQYLKSQMEKEADFEKEIDKLYQDELDRIWKKRQEEWEEDKMKRRQLEQDVMKGVKGQILANMERGRQVQSMNQVFAQKVLEEDEEDTKKAVEKLRLIRERNAKHQQELLDQIRLKEERLKEEKRLKDQQVDNIRHAREVEQAKIRQLLSDMKIDNEHPYRVCRREFFNDCDE